MTAKKKAPKKAKLTHVDASGRAKMVDVSGKPITEREAKAKGRVKMGAETLKAISTGKVAKGDVLTTARLAGIMAAKRTHDLIPLCHPLGITDIQVELTPNKKARCVEIEAKVKCTGRTGVEMEALTAASVAALTVYDMAKAIDRNMVISDIRLVEKTGGRSGTFRRKGEKRLEPTN